VGRKYLLDPVQRRLVFVQLTDAKPSIGLWPLSDRRDSWICGVGTCGVGMTTSMPGDPKPAKPAQPASAPKLLKLSVPPAGKPVLSAPKPSVLVHRKATASADLWRTYVDKPKVVQTKGPVTKVVAAVAPLSAGCAAIQDLRAMPTSYVNPERLMDDIAEIYRARDRVFQGLDQLDCAARNAGTPIRSTSARERFTHLLGVIRGAEADARKAWQSELAAAGGMTPQLTKLVVAAGAADARTIDSLLAKDGDELSVDEYEELVVVLDGAIIDSADQVGAGAQDYAASFFASVDNSKLARLVATLASWTAPDYRDTARGRQAQRVQSELRALFERAVEHDDVFARYPAFAARIEALDVRTLNVLLLTDEQTVRRDRPALLSDPGAGRPIGISSGCLVRLAQKILVDPKSLFLPVSSDSKVPSPRMTILRLLEADTQRGGGAVARYLAPATTSVAGMEAASTLLLALVAPDRSGWLVESRAEAALSAKVMKSFFVQAFDHGTDAQVRAAAEVLELTIANTAKLGVASHPMLAALATGFAGTMIHPLTAGELLNAGARDNGTAPGSIRNIARTGFNPGGTDLGAFLTRLATDPLAVRTIFGSLGPMLRTASQAGEGLPATATLIDGWGFIQGAILSKFDEAAQNRRAMIDGTSAWLTAGLAAFGALAGGPGTSMAAGFLGSGVLQTIASMVDVPIGNTEGIATTEKAIRSQLALVYVTSLYSQLQNDTKKRITDALAEVQFKATRPKVEFTADGRLQIANLPALLPEDVKLAFGTITSAALSENNVATTIDQLAINSFAKLGAQTVQVIRNAK
jgi:hypothetical protein